MTGYTLIDPDPRRPRSNRPDPKSNLSPAAGKWAVWRVFYGSYAEIEAEGNRAAQLVEAGLSFDQAQKLAESLGDDYCLKPSA